MLETLHCLRTRSDIKELKKLDNSLIAVGTSLHGVRIFSIDECDTKATILHDKLNASTTAISFSPNAEFMAFSNEAYIYILHMPSKIVLKTIKTDGEKIEQLEFDLESKYIIAATASGRILQYRYDGSSLLGRLYSFENQNNSNKTKATAFAFNKNIMACGSNRGTIFSINLHSRANKVIIQNDSSKINSICFIDSTNIVTADEKGNLYFSSLKSASLVKKVETGFTQISQILLMPNSNYLMVLGNEKYVAVYDINSYKLLHSKYIEFEDIPTNMIIIDDNTLLASLENNSIEKVFLPNTDKLKSFIQTNSLDKAFSLIRKDPLLRDTKEYKVLEVAYDNIYNKALEALSKQNKDKALQLTKMFKYVDEKSADIQLLFKSFENYPRFKILYAEKKYALAYAMCSKFPALTKTFQYAKMEEAWEDIFKNAQRQIAHGQLENAVSLLNEFATVTQKRPIIKLVLKHNDDFIVFLKAIESKDFQKIDKIAGKNELFTFIPTYKDVQHDMKIALDSVEDNIKKSKLNLAVQQLSKLNNIACISQRVSMFKDECKAVKKLQDAYEANNFIQCFEIIDKNHVLNSTDLGTLLQKHWHKLMLKSEALALKGNIKDIKETLGELIHLSTRRDKIGDLFRLSFHTKIKALIHKKIYNKAESIIYSYIDIFGSDREIISIMRIYEVKSKTKLAITQGSRVSRDNWINSDTILPS